MVTVKKRVYTQFTGIIIGQHQQTFLQKEEVRVGESRKTSLPNR